MKAIPWLNNAIIKFSKFTKSYFLRLKLFQNNWNTIGDENEEGIEAVIEKVTERKSALSSRRRQASSPKPVDPLPKFDLSQIVPDDLDDNEERPHSKK